MNLNEMRLNLKSQGDNIDLIESIIKTPVGILDDVNWISIKNFEEIFKGNMTHVDDTI